MKKDYNDKLTNLLSEIILIQPLSMLGQDTEVTVTWKFLWDIQLAIVIGFPENLFFHIQET